MHAPIPEHEPSLEILLLLLALEVLKQKAKLLAERVQALPPVAAAVLVLVADENFVEEVVDVVEHGDVVGRGIEEGSSRDG